MPYATKEKRDAYERKRRLRRKNDVEYKEKQKQYMKEYREKNREYFRIKSEEYRLNNPEVCRERVKISKSRKGEN